ncbi:MAG: hypothetical protein EBZ83_07065 [Verrucomicrobia bacterium]|jgi:hypothetical protein|nr:hypothetical protein [Verrucomicrobiota bacterium]NDC01161.1 hypothetical protein [Verrucomicrobiota bacterium]
MADGSISPAPARQSRLRPRLYGVAIYLVAGILLLQVFFCLSVFFLRPYANSKTPEAILGQERVRASDALIGSRLQERPANPALSPQTNIPAAPSP